MLRIDRLNHYYGKNHILWNLELDVPRGQCTCVMGRNGAGKTTLMKCIMGAEPVKSGSLAFAEGVELTQKNIEDRARLGIGYVPQGRQIFPMLTVEDNLRSGLGLRQSDSKIIPARVYELFPELREMRHRRGSELSDGQQQQLAIGQALVIEPRLLILDEPAEGLQPNIVARIGKVIRKLIEEDGLTVLLAEQKLPFARKYADRFAILDQGRRVAEGDIAGLTDELIEKHLTV